MTSPDIKPIRIYTGNDCDLVAGQSTIKLETDNYSGFKFYTITLEQLTLILLTGYAFQFNYYTKMFKHTCAYLVENTNIETVDYCDSIFKEHRIYLNLINYIAVAFRSGDHRMWKHVLDKTFTNGQIKEYTVNFFRCIYSFTEYGLDDQLDHFVSCLAYIDTYVSRSKCMKYFGTFEIKPNIDMYIYDCIKNSTFKICKYLLEQFKLNDIQFNISNMVIAAVFQTKYEFVDMILNYSLSNSVVFGLFQTDIWSLDNCKFFHQLVIDERIDIIDDDIYSMMNSTGFFKCPEAFIYMLTAFPYWYRRHLERHELDECVKELAYEIIEENEQLMEELTGVISQKVDVPKPVKQRMKCMIL